MTESHADELVGQTLTGGYKILSALSGGGMGTVYRAEHLQLQKVFAVKTLKPEFGQEQNYRERFEQEARAASKISHDNVVDISNFGELEDGRPFFVMEYLEGEDLYEIIKREGRLHWGRVCVLIRQIMWALEAAHGRGIIHRDVKPANCLVVAGADGTEKIKVIDFGIAKVKELNAAVTSELTQTGAPIGTVKYMAPEQLRCEAIDARADVYALGVMTYELLTGRVPFEARVASQLIAQHLTEDPPPFSEAAPGVEIPPALESMVLRALAKRPLDRFQTMAEFERALEVAIGGQLPPEAYQLASGAGGAGRGVRIGNDTTGRSRSGRSNPLSWIGTQSVPGQSGARSRWIGGMLVGGLTVAVAVFLGMQYADRQHAETVPRDAVAQQERTPSALGSEPPPNQDAAPEVARPRKAAEDTQIAEHSSNPAVTGVAERVTAVDTIPEEVEESTQNDEGQPETEENQKTRMKTKTRPARPARKEASDLIARELTAEQFAQSRRDLQPQISSCKSAYGSRFPTTFRVKFRVVESGRVVGAHPLDEPASNPLVRCVLDTVQSARFPENVEARFKTWSFEL